MQFTKKFDRAFQWAGEKMGNEAKTSMSDDFKNLETEMALRHDGTYSQRRRPAWPKRGRAAACRRRARAEADFA